MDTLEKEIANLKAEIEGRTIRLERLVRKRADMDLLSLESPEFEEGSLHETSKEEVQAKPLIVAQLFLYKKQVLCLLLQIRYPVNWTNYMSILIFLYGVVSQHQEL